MDAQMKRGFLEACVLATIDRRESYGYQIVKDVPLTLGLTESTLYPLLKRLEAAQCIAVRTAEHNGRLRKYYRITEAGKLRIAEFVAERSEVLAIYDYVEAATGRGSMAQSLSAEATPDAAHAHPASSVQGGATARETQPTPQNAASALATRQNGSTSRLSADQFPFSPRPANASSI